MARRAAARGRGAKATTVDFSGVEGSRRVPDDDYPVKSTEVTLKSGEESGEGYFNFKLAITDGEHKGKALWHTCSLKESALWNLRATIEAGGMTIPEGPMSFKPKGDRYPELEGLEFGVSVENEVWNGKKKPRVVDVFALDEFEEEDGGDEVEEEEVEPEGEEETEVEEEEEAAIEVDASVVFNWEEEELAGTVTAISDDGETVTVLDAEGYEYEVSADEVFLTEDV